MKIILTVLITSFYFFPVDFTFLPTNTKNLLGAIGFVFIVFELIRQKDFSVPKQLIILLLLSSMVSVISLISITYNQTHDTTYVTYIRSAIIWLCGAFAVGFIIKAIHGNIDVPLVTHYLIGACIFQCVFAMLIEFIPAVREFVDRYVQQGQELLKEMGRLYGLGASLDVAGSRFAAVLVAIAFLLVSSPKNSSIGKTVFYTFSFGIITVIGNMIARTTSVGSVIGIAWIILGPLILLNDKRTALNTGKGIALFGTFALLIGISIALYNAFPDVKDLFRFGFEGFFSWAESGEWQTDSTSKLESMVVWPEELRTWIIGDGYFANSRYDPNYLGDSTNRGFYMGTDVGYLRFIFYFGIAGLVWIIAIIAYSAFVCANQFKSYTWLFIMALVVGLAVWVKVSTDIFLFFYLFLCAAYLQDVPGGDKLPNEASETAKPA
ncbi:MAG: hypothetical protein IJK90_05915 [Bacteroidales bacterium]|nr:hypothetical protein [Bacteroidales bacterium]